MADADGYEAPLWRALAVFRWIALVYATIRVVHDFPAYEHPVAGWTVVAVMVAWTLLTTFGYERVRLPRWPLLAADIAVIVGCLLVSPPVLGAQARADGVGSIPAAWMAGPVLAWAISGGRRLGAFAAFVVGAVQLFTSATINESAVDSPVLLLLAGLTVGHVARLFVGAQERLQRAAELEAAGRERDRLARGIHDSVLQVLTLVQRRGAEAGGEAAELGRLAGEQEAALRSLVAGVPAAPDATHADLRALLLAYAGGSVSIAAPAHPVPVKKAVADELARAVDAALSNVTRHCGSTARAWVLLEADGAGVTVTVRDDGPGIAAGRLEEAAAAGRLGVAQSIRGRIAELGGTVTISSSPGHGTEVELRVPLR
jgi:signal transduction histidine kinase